MKLIIKLLFCVLFLLPFNASEAIEGFSLIPAGEFMMGDSLDYFYDAPSHAVILDAFYIGKYEVTKNDWDVVRNWAVSNGYNDLAKGLGSGGNHPVHSISWYDMVKWCNARSEKEGLKPVYYVEDAQVTVYRNGQIDLTNSKVKWRANGYRLPTEAEWEKAARGGISGKRFPWSDTIRYDQANYTSSVGISYDLSGAENTHRTDLDGNRLISTFPVGSFASNYYELYDISGNISEMCWDRLGNYLEHQKRFSSSAIQVNPRGTDENIFSSPYRINRGGSWNAGASYCRVANRSSTFADNYFVSYGFRLAFSAPSAESDADGDGLYAADEIYFGSDPSVSDTDKDGVLDREEVLSQYVSDADGDGYSDGEEILWDADLNDRSSFPLVYVNISCNEGGRIDPQDNTEDFWSWNTLFNSGYVVGNLRSQVRLKAVPESGYLFTSWTGDVNGTSNLLDMMLTDPFPSIQANFEPDQSDSDGDGLSNYAEVVTHSTNPNFSDSDADGYSDSEEVERGADPNDGLSKPQVYLSFLNNGGDCVRASGIGGDVTWSGESYNGYVDMRSTVTLTAVPYGGLIFSGWTGDASGKDNPLSLSMDSNKSVQANYEYDAADSDGDGWANYEEALFYGTNPNDSLSMPQVYLSISSSSGGQINVSGIDYYDWWMNNSYSGYVTRNTTLTFSQVADDGYLFTGWSGDAAGTTNILDLKMDADKSIQANFERDNADNDNDGLTNYEETVVYSTNANSSDSDEDGYSDGEEVVWGSDPDVSWSKPMVNLSISSYGNGRIDTIGVDYWSGWGYQSQSGEAALRSTVNLTAVPDRGYRFIGWFGDAYGTSSPLNLQMDTNKSVHADFELDYSDSDGDGLMNYEELTIYHTNPNASDTDDDGHSDAKEIQRGSDPNNSASIPEKLGNYIGSFDPISNKVYGGSSFLINLPTASSGLPVVVSVKSGPAKVEGNRVLLTGAGIVVLAANQPGDEDYKAANEATVSFAVLDLKNMTGEYIGNFNAEYFEGAQEAMNRNGQLSMKLVKGGAFTGSMVISGSRMSIRGKFDDYGSAEISVSSKTISKVLVDISIESMTETEFQVGASIRWSDEKSSEFVCYPVAYTGTGGTNNCTLAGKQINSLLISQMLSGIDFGHGFAKIKVSANGSLAFAGRMADGSTVSGTSRLVKDEYGDLLAQASFPLPAVKGLLHGVAVLQTDPEAGQYHLASPYEWTWARLPKSRARIFKEGFAEKLNVYGQVWNYTKGQSVLPEGLDGFTFQVDPDLIVLEEPLDLWGSWPSSNKPTWDYTPKGFTFKVNPITGDISGTAPRTIDGKPSKAATYQGLLLRPGLETYDGSPLIGGGYILGLESSGVVELTAP